MDIPHDGIGLCNLLKYMTIRVKVYLESYYYQIEDHLYTYIQHFQRRIIIRFIHIY